MQSLKKIVINGLIVLFLSSGLMVSALAELNEQEQMADAFRTLNTSAEQGNPNAQYVLAALYQKIEDHPTAFKWFEKSALQGNEGSQSKVGLMYYTGLGVRQDYSKAFEFSLKAANKKVEASYFPVAVMYEFGQGVRQDYKKAKEWYGKSCDSGQQSGCDGYRELNEKGN